MTETLPARLSDLKAADVFANQQALDAILAEIDQAATAEVHDISTLKGRKAIASTAAKVARSKTYIDEKLGKPLVADWKAKAATVDRLRKHARDHLDALKTEVRKPLTEYEQQEKDRQARISDLLDGWRAEYAVALRDKDHGALSSENIGAQIARIEAIDINPALEDRQTEARQIKDATLYQLRQTLDRAKEYEAEQARIAKEKAEREQIEREERERKIAEQAAAKARREAEEAARKVIEAERYRAEQEKQKTEREARERAEREQREKQAEISRKEKAKAEDEARAKSRDHQALIHRETLEDLLKIGLSEDHGKAIIAAIRNQQVRHLVVAY